MNLSKWLGIGRLAGPITIFPTLDQAGNWLAAAGPNGQPRKMRDGNIVMLARCLYTLLINDAPKKRDGTPGALNRKTVVDFSWGRIANVYLKYTPVGTELYVEGRDVTFRKDLGQNLPANQRYVQTNSVQAAQVLLGNRSAKAENETHTTYRMFDPRTGKTTEYSVELAPRQQVVRAAAPVGTSDPVGAFGEMLGGRVTGSRTVTTPAGIVTPGTGVQVARAPQGVSPLVSAFQVG